MRKPEHRIYHHMIQQLGVDANQIVFLDDLGVNLKAAKEIGINTIKVPFQKGGVQQALKTLEEILKFPLKRNFPKF